jgi:arginyl-tRNA synthetase
MKDDSLKFEAIEKMGLVDRVSYLGDSYILGTNYYDNLKDADAVETINDLNYYLSSLAIDSLKEKDYSKFEELNIKEKYIKGRQWCLDYFEIIYKRLGTKFDYYFFESEVGKAGLKVVLDNVGDIFEEDDGAIVYRGDESKGLHTRVFVNKHGVPTYEAKELGLFLAKAEKINYDESVVITANEQSGYFKVVLDALGRVDSRLANASRHMPHGMIKLPGSEKMSSRKGNILSGEWLLNETKNKVKSLMLKNDRSYSDDMDTISEKIAIASIKHAFLKVGVGRDVDFDFEEAISFDGNTGPYLLYVYARCNSLIKDSSITPNGIVCLGSCVGNAYLKELMAKISNYKSFVLDSGLAYSPSTLIQYLFELGKVFNNFYQNVRVLDAAEEEKQLLINVIYATMYTIKDGLKNLGIEVVEEM